MSAFLDRPGIFKATCANWTLAETKESGIPVFQVEYHPTAMLDGKEWIAWSEYDQMIVGRHFPFKKDGTPNEKTIKQLMEALGWDGQSLKSLQDGDYSHKEVQIVVKEETYEGKARLNVAWLNPGDYEPGLKEMDPTKVSAMASQWDAKLRAVSGAAPVAKKTPSVPPKKG